MEQKEDHKPHICNGYVQAEHLPLNQSTAIRAQKTGIGGLMFKFFTDILVAVEQLEIRENTYEDVAKIVKVVQDTVSPILERYPAPINIEYSFRANQFSARIPGEVMDRILVALSRLGGEIK